MSNPLPVAAARAPWALRGLFAVACVLLLREAKPLLAPVLYALVLTFMLVPLVRRLKRMGIPEGIAAAVVVTLLLASAVPLTIGLVRPAAQWWQRAPTTLAQLGQQFDRLRAAIPGLGPPASVSRTPAAAVPAQHSTAGALRVGARDVPAPAQPAPAPDPVKDRLASEGLALTGALLRQSLTFTLSATATVLLLYFMLAAEHWLLRRIVEAVPRRRARALLLGALRACQRDIGRYLVAMSLINVAVGVLMGVIVHLLGLPNPTLWGAIVAVLTFVPYLGPLLSALLLLLAGLLTFGDLPSALAPALAFVAVHAVETNLLSPWLMARRLSMSAISIFLSVMFWGWLWGIAGAVIAVPVLMHNVVRRSGRWRLLNAVLQGNQRHAAPSLRSLLGRRARPTWTTTTMDGEAPTAEVTTTAAWPPTRGHVNTGTTTVRGAPPTTAAMRIDHGAS